VHVAFLPCPCHVQAETPEPKTLRPWTYSGQNVPSLFGKSMEREWELTHIPHPRLNYLFTSLLNSHSTQTINGLKSPYISNSHSLPLIPKPPTPQANTIISCPITNDTGTGQRNAIPLPLIMGLVGTNMEVGGLLPLIHRSLPLSRLHSPLGTNEVDDGQRHNLGWLVIRDGGRNGGTVGARDGWGL
jgi:hypothetical protein